MRQPINWVLPRASSRLSKLRRFSKSLVDPRYGKAVVGSHVRLGRGACLGGMNSIGNFSSLEGNVSLGYASTLGEGCILRGNINIGNYCQFAPHVALYSRMHPVEHATIYVNVALLDGRMKSFQPDDAVVVGHDVWIGHGAAVLSGVTIGDGAVVGAGAIVTKSVPDYGMAVGNPARVIRMRFEEDIVEHLRQLRWWELSVEQLVAFEDLFQVNLAQEPERALELLKECQERKMSILNAG